MSEPVTPPTDSAVPDAPAAPTGDASASLATLPESALEATGEIERLTERLRFYESFDELIQRNIAQSGQLVREAANKRDEAVAAIAESRRQIETERESQRSTLTELLDDVMMIQQATERLAHRVSDALEQIEFELEPIGLQGTAALGGPGTTRLPETTGDRRRTDAEDVHEELNVGVISHPVGRGAMPPSNPVESGLVVPDDDRIVTAAQSAPAPSWSSSATASHNPETEAPAADEPAARDVGSMAGSPPDDADDREAEPGEGSDGALVEADAESWAAPSSDANEELVGVDDLSRVAEQTSTSSDGEPASTGQEHEHEGTGQSDLVESELSGLGPGDASVEVTERPMVIEATAWPPEEAGDHNALETGAGSTPAEHETTVVLDGVPRAAIALALQRHILACPDVLRAEVREYCDHRLTLFVTGSRPTTASDIRDWDGSAAWEQLHASPDRVELRLAT